MCLGKKSADPKVPTLWHSYCVTYCALRVPRLCYFLHQENCPSGQVLVMEGPELQVHELYIDLLLLLSTSYFFYPFHCLLLPQRQRELENQRRYKCYSRKRKTMLKVLLGGGGS